MKIKLLGDVVPSSHELAAMVNAIPEGIEVIVMIVEASGTTVKRAVKVMERAPWGGDLKQVGIEWVEEPVFVAGLNVGGQVLPIEQVLIGGGGIPITVRQE
ncbi:MAG: hypothetical protein WCP21_17095 [Armatimonadota bacterium]